MQRSINPKKEIGTQTRMPILVPRIGIGEVHLGFRSDDELPAHRLF
jgi:hypothetical protein